MTALTGKSPKSFVQNAIRMAVDSRVTRVAETFKYVTARPGALGSVPGSGVSDGGVSVPDVRGPSRESLW
ncbi:hypothetical protein B6K05_015275 [Mycobacterium avium subsp. hominissuis]|nr:hypothetical protein B6K05_015275 [Mycobacterium avium subsp. hominissuis]